MTQVRAWLQLRSDDRSGFYSAREDQIPNTPTAKTATAAPAAKKGAAKRVSNASIAVQLSAITAQLEMLSHRQDKLEQKASSSAGDALGPKPGVSTKLPAVSAGLPNGGSVSMGGVAKAMSVMSPPPKIRSPPQKLVPETIQDEPYDALQPEQEDESKIARVIAQQSSALTALVAHLTAQSSDALGDLVVPGQTSSTTKGVQRRERMQQELAQGTSNYFQQLMQQLHRRVNPSRPIPQGDEDLYGLSMLSYLERQGGYRNHRELGLVAWVLGHAIDSAAANDFRHTKEILALLMIAVEQAVVDRGDWTLAFMLTLLEEPPLTMFQERSLNLAHHSKPFGPLVPAQMTAVCLSYLKDLEVLSTKKQETSKRPAKTGSPSAENPKPSEDDKEASPKRKARFPRKPKAKATAEA